MIRSFKTLRAHIAQLGTQHDHPEYKQAVQDVLELIPRGPGAKLTVRQERELRDARAEGESVKDLAIRFGLTKQAVYNILQQPAPKL